MTHFQQVQRNYGVDSQVPGSEWMMVPERGENVVLLTDATGFTVAEAGAKRRLKVQEITKAVFAHWGGLGALLLPNARAYKVSSRMTGEALIEATKGKLSLQLKVSVHPKRTFKIAFFFLQDRGPNGAVTPRTSFSPSNAAEWIKDLNKVFGPQANIFFEQEKAEYLPIAGLGTSVGSESDLAKLAGARAASKATITVFIAGNSVQNLDGAHPYGFFHIASKIIVVQDQFVADPWAGRTKPMLKTIAHEIGHFLNHHRGAGQGHDYYKTNGYTSDILNTLDGGDIKISRQRVLDWNPW